jgi:hypothetical protein
MKILILTYIFNLIFLGSPKEKKIFYEFPENIDSVLTTYFTEKANLKDNLVFIQIGSISDSTEIYIYSVGNKTTNMQLRNILSSTNRYYRVNKVDIPIIFDADFLFSNTLNKNEKGKYTNFAISHFDLYIRFIGRVIYGAKILEVLK